MNAFSTSRPRILLCSAWQNVNIGDIAHTPGILALLETHFPEAQITLWPFKPLTPEAVFLICQRFPALQIVEGTVTAQGEISTPELAAAFDESDFLLHASGACLVAWKDVQSFHKLTGKPFGVYGVTYGLNGIPEKSLLSDARFVYFRDGASLERAKNEGVSAPVVEWAPDVAFATDVRAEARAEAFLAANDLKTGQFLCCIARLRYTPYWTIRGHPAPFDATKHARNEAMKAHDHAPLIEAIIAVARQTSLKVLICPEDITQMEVGRQNLLDMLPKDVQKRVVWREDFWLPDEAISVYARSAGVFGLEMHSPIMAIGNGIPALVGRFAEQNTKGFMWRDVGLEDWLFDLDDETDRARIVPTVLALAQNPQAAKIRAQKARDLVRARFAETMSIVRREVLQQSAHHVSLAQS